MYIIHLKYIKLNQEDTSVLFELDSQSSSEQNQILQNSSESTKSPK